MRITLGLIVLVSATLLLGGCVTQSKVKEIVATSNAAMVTPFLNAPGEASQGSWKDASAKIDQLIAAYPEEKILVNSLRVRQAMLLTVNKQDNLARQVWSQIVSDALTTERDKSLFDSREVLVWWYVRGPDGQALNSQEKKAAEGYLARLDNTIAALQGKDIRIYLGTIRAQIALRIRNDSAATDGTAQGFAADLSKYVELFSDDDQDWVKDQKNANIKEEGMIITDLRNRVWLRSMVKEFKKRAWALLCKNSAPNTACDPGPAPVWKPEWVQGYN